MPAGRQLRLSFAEDIRVRDWNDLNRRLFDNTWNENLQRFRSDFVYRGMSDRNHTLRTSLIRLGGQLGEVEGHLLRNFRKYARQDAVQTQSVWDWLAVAAHHGLPTRLLDWTYSPYVALHFMTQDLRRFDHDGIIWCVNYVEVHKLLPPRLRRILLRERSNAFTVEMLAEAVPSLGGLQKMSRHDFALFLEPPSLDQRIVNQFALFSMMSSPSARLDEWLLRRSARLVRRIIVPSGLKWEVRDKLDQANITERVLFPGLDGLSRWLRRHYTPRLAAEARKAA